MSSSNLLPRLTALARSWPKDPLRPAEHLQLGQAIQKNLGSVRFDQLTKEETQYADKAISALESIIDGRESREHPIAAHVLAPKSDPEYYQRVKRNIEKVQRGEQIKDFTFAQKVKIFFGANPKQFL